MKNLWVHEYRIYNTRPEYRILHRPPHFTPLAFDRENSDPIQKIPVNPPPVLTFYQYSTYINFHSGHSLSNASPTHHLSHTSGIRAMKRSDEGTSAGSEKKYLGVRRRKWGKWVSEIRVPTTRTRLWLGSYSNPEAAAVAHDTAEFCLRGTASIRNLNFPSCVPTSAREDMSPDSIQRLATAAGMDIDARLKARFAKDVGASNVYSTLRVDGEDTATWSTQHAAPVAGGPITTNSTAGIAEVPESMGNLVVGDGDDGQGRWLRGEDFSIFMDGMDAYFH
ncbi:ethylene-responsive transcription factor ERF037-like [Magnolia sinica]|uniref:ethylene-responsive transcription factor ERF037-like n=1 Tax=Magnolia sinica TaxID=86752 RepID=UPI00265A2D6A|nr:ethylene-responsive transcription factor ERF037-like [Magnolia sinica]